MAVATDQLTKSAAMRADTRRDRSAALRWAALGVLTCSAFVAGFAATGPETAARAAASAGEDLTLLMRMMAALKGLAVAALVAGLAWRFASAVSPRRLAAYLTSAVTMAAGIGPMWEMAHVVGGAAMLHAGLIASAILLWRDPAVSRRLAERLRSRTHGARVDAGLSPGES